MATRHPECSLLLVGHYNIISMFPLMCLFNFVGVCRPLFGKLDLSLVHLYILPMCSISSCDNLWGFLPTETHSISFCLVIEEYWTRSSLSYLRFSSSFVPITAISLLANGLKFVFDLVDIFLR